MRRVAGLAIGLVLSTLLLGGGWLASTLREREMRLDAERSRLVRAADAVRSAVDESLEELRAREDERAFYLYNHFYSPPDVLAISDPIAISPLAQPPTDARLIGHFQIDVAQGVATPYETIGEEPPPLATRIASIVGAPAFEPLRALALGRPLELPEATGLAVTDAPSEEITNEGSLVALRAIGDGRPQNRSEENAPQQVGLNNWGNVQAQEIVAAQQGDPSARESVIARGRQAPRISRRNVAWELVEEQRQAPSQQPQRSGQQRSSSTASSDRSLPSRPSRELVRGAMDRVRADVVACAPEAELDVRVRVRGLNGRPQDVEVLRGTEHDEARRCVERALEAVRLPRFTARLLDVRYVYRPTVPTQDLAATDNVLIQPEAEVTYTEMAFRELDGQLLLHRVVSHEGVSVVQGVLLDREHLAAQWIPHVIERHVDPEARPQVLIDADDAVRCSVRRPASSAVSGFALCFGNDALRGTTAELDRELTYQVFALFALLLIAILAALALVLAMRRAEALSRQKSTFVSAVSHELRTPLTTLRMHAEMLDEGLVSEERLPKVHRELVSESVRLARLVDNVLSLSKLEEGRRTIRLQQGDLAQHVRDVVDSQRRFVEERGFGLSGPEDGVVVQAMFDAQAIDQIVVNLIENAVKYGASEDASSIEVWVGKRDGMPTLEVRDRGPGIAPAERDKVFERFHRVERAETAHAPGTGIGLSLVRDLAVAHGGTATVHPRDGGGLEARVTLPAAGSPR